MRITICLTLLALSGCGVIAIDRAKMDYDKSRTAFKACLLEHTPAECEGPRQAMNADARNWAMMRGNAIGLEIGQ